MTPKKTTLAALIALLTLLYSSFGFGADDAKSEVFRFTPEPEGRRQILVETSDGSYQWRLRAPERVFCDEGVLVGHDIWRVDTPVAWTKTSEGGWSFERKNRDDTKDGSVKHAIDYQLQIDPEPYGALLTLSVKNTGNQTLHNIVGHICLGHLSEPFRDPSFQRSYVRVDDEFLSLGKTDRGSNPIRAHYIVRGYPPIKLFNNPDNRFWGGPSPEKTDNGLILTVTESGQQGIALWFDPASEVFQNSDEPNMCIHSDPYFGDLEPGASREVQGKLILFEGTLIEFESDYLK